MKNLRSRILKDGIRCCPWWYWKGEIDLLPISSKTLFRNTGVSFDTLQNTLKEEGWLLPNENLLLVLREQNNLKRKHISKETPDERLLENQDDWTEEDFKYHYENPY